ncbi:MAG TPA: recombination protein NinB [Aquabacterium sp.]|nr:recombination protein NinB [Aquabacterium sp.]
MRQEQHVVLQGCDASHVYELIDGKLRCATVRITIEELGNGRTQQQNALLWALYGDILRKGGEILRGWTKDDLHEMFLIEHFGSNRISLGKRHRLKPRRRSSRLSKVEFSEFIDFIVRYMAEQGVVLRLPGDLP